LGKGIRKSGEDKEGRRPIDVVNIDDNAWQNSHGLKYSGRHKKEENRYQHPELAVSSTFALDHHLHWTKYLLHDCSSPASGA
jgi:hypothetical protein